MFVSSIEENETKIKCKEWFSHGQHVNRLAFFPTIIRFILLLFVSWFFLSSDDYCSQTERFMLLLHEGKSVCHTIQTATETCFLEMGLVIFFSFLFVVSLPKNTETIFLKKKTTRFFFLFFFLCSHFCPEQLQRMLTTRMLILVLPPAQRNHDKVDDPSTVRIIKREKWMNITQNLNN